MQQHCNSATTLQHFKIAVQCNTSATAPFCGQSRRGGGILIACCIYTHPPCHTLLIRLYHNIFSSHDGNRVYLAKHLRPYCPCRRLHRGCSQLTQPRPTMRDFSLVPEIYVHNLPSTYKGYFTRIKVFSGSFPLNPPLHLGLCPGGHALRRPASHGAFKWVREGINFEKTTNFMPLLQ